MPYTTANLRTTTRVKAWAFRQISKSHTANYLLDGFGNLASGITRSYVPGRIRSSYEIFNNVANPTQLEVREAGIYADERMLTNNPFLAESFLEKGITGINLTLGFTPKDLINLSKTGFPLYTDKLDEITDEEKASQLLEAVKNKNLMLQLKTYGFAAISTSISYLLYRAATLALLNGTAWDFVFSALLTAGIAFDSFLVTKNQHHLISGQKYTPPVTSEETKHFVAGNEGPKATIMVPALNEPLEVMEQTLLAAARQNYTNKEVVLLLDDPPESAAIPNVYKMVERVNETLEAEGKTPCVKVLERKKYGNVLNQTRNKADNLNAFLVYGKGKKLIECTDRQGRLLLLTEEEYQQSPETYFVLKRMEFDSAEHVVIIDADYRLVPEFLSETVAVLHENPETALVQTPQNLVPQGNTEIERISATGINANWQFLRRGNAQDGSLFWGGTNCTIRVTALESIERKTEAGATEFVSTRNITEDLYTSLLLLKKGWKFGFIPKPMAEGLPINNLSDHFTTFWRYVEGTTEATLEQTLPHMLRNPRYAISKPGIEFLNHGIQGFMGYPIMFFAAAPMLAVLGFDFPSLQTVPFLSLFGLSLWFNSRSARLSFKRLGAKPFDHVKGCLLFILHSPVYVHATLTAIKNRITGTRAKFLRTPKDGERSAVPLKYLLPLLGIPTLNLISFGLGVSQYLDGQTWKLHPVAWSLFNSAAITYALLYFNGIKNTWRDLKLGIKREVIGRIFS